MIPDTVPVSGVWLRKIGNDVQVLLEVDEKWHVVIDEVSGSHSSHDHSHIVGTEDILASCVNSATAR